MAAENGTATFQDLVTGDFYNVDVYYSDSAGAAATFNMAGAAVSTSDNSIKFDNPVKLVKLNIHTGTASAVGLYITANGKVVNGSSLRFLGILDTIQPAPVFNIGFKAGATIKIIQF